MEKNLIEEDEEDQLRVGDIIGDEDEESEEETPAPKKEEWDVCPFCNTQKTKKGKCNC